MVDRVKMDMNKIAFIICCNDEPALEECLLYINDLRIPEQFQTEILVIREADSMTSAYNACPCSSQTIPPFVIWLAASTLTP